MEWGRGRLPVDVLSIKDLAESRRGEVVRDMDGNSTEIRRHSKVGNCTSEERDCEQVVEDALPLLGEEGQADNDEEGEGVDGAHGPEPV